jgi:flagellar hook-associated protein 1 FlgK
MDRRDLLVDRLASLVDAQAIDRGNGTIDVVLGGLQLVSAGGGVQPLSVVGGGTYKLRFGTPPVPITAGQGSIRGLIDAANALGARGTAATRATGLRGQLDDFALSLVSAVNQIHSDYDPVTKPLQPTLTPPPVPLRAVGAFFDPNGVTAASIDLDAAIKADPTQIAGGYSTAAGVNTIVLRLAGLRTLAVPIPGGTAATPNSPAVTPGQPIILGDYFGTVVSALGIATRDADGRATSQSSFVQHLGAQRQDQQGVSIDEEMVRLIEHQQAYTAAARLIQMADEMLQELINIGR